MITDHPADDRHPGCPPGAHTELSDVIGQLTETRLMSKEGNELAAALHGDPTVDYDMVMQHGLERLLHIVMVEYLEDESRDHSPAALMHLAGVVGFSYGRTWQEMDTVLLAQDRQLQLPNYMETPEGEDTEFKLPGFA